MKTKRFDRHNYRTELHHTGSAPNCRPLLKVFRSGDFSQPVAEVELTDFCGVAQWFYEGYLEHNLQLKRQSPTFRRLLKRGRKGLGYSYP